MTKLKQYLSCIPILFYGALTQAACGYFEGQQSVLVTEPVELTIKNNTHDAIKVTVDDIIKERTIQAYGYLRAMWAIPYACRITWKDGRPGYRGYHAGADNRDLHIQITDAYTENVIDFYVNPVCGYLTGPGGGCASLTTHPTPQTQKSRFRADVQTHNTAITLQINKTEYDER